MDATDVTVCESCAGEDDDLVPVWRLPEGAGQVPELWCADCRDRYPHEPAEGDEADDAEAG